MNPNCAACSKTVYPTEKLNCLDKIWHKSCFKCQTCNMTLNMKNYKGYEKMPYCNAHYPTTKHTQVADTPESRRIAENTKIQSNREYHEAYEKSKAKYTPVADRADMKHHQENKKNVSKLAYTKEFEKSKAKYTPVADRADMMHHRENKKNVSMVEYQKEFEKTKDKYTPVADPLEMAQLLQNSKEYSLVAYHKDFEKSKAKYSTVADTPEMLLHKQNRRLSSTLEYTKEFEKSKAKYTAVADSPEMMLHQQNRRMSSTVDYTSEHKKMVSKYTPVPDLEMERHLAMRPKKKPKPRIKYHEDFERQKGKKMSVADDPETLRLSQNQMTASQIAYKGLIDQKEHQEQVRPQSQINEDDGFSGGDEFQNGGGRRRQPGSITDYDPENDKWGSIAEAQPPRQQQQQQQQQQAATKGMMCKAIYDYAAADTDEVSFVEDDVIVYCQPVDEGWMMGTVERTGQRGMLPSNYVERVN